MIKFFNNLKKRITFKRLFGLIITIMIALAFSNSIFSFFKHEVTNILILGGLLGYLIKFLVQVGFEGDESYDKLPINGHKSYNSEDPLKKITTVLKMEGESSGSQHQDNRSRVRPSSSSESEYRDTRLRRSTTPTPELNFPSWFPRFNPNMDEVAKDTLSDRLLEIHNNRASSWLGLYLDPKTLAARRVEAWFKYNEEKQELAKINNGEVKVPRGWREANGAIEGKKPYLPSIYLRDDSRLTDYNKAVEHWRTLNNQGRIDRNDLNEKSMLHQHASNILVKRYFMTKEEADIVGRRIACYIVLKKTGWDPDK